MVCLQITIFLMTTRWMEIRQKSSKLVELASLATLDNVALYRFDGDDDDDAY